jgi:hypothetical protein
MSDAPEMQGQLVSAHGMLAILEVLEGRGSREAVMRLLQIINLVALCVLIDGGYVLTVPRLAAGHGRCQFSGGVLSDWVCSLLAIRPSPTTELISCGRGIPVMMGA